MGLKTQKETTYSTNMRWFEGSIPAAIASAKQQSLVFVVVITGMFLDVLASYSVQRSTQINDVYQLSPFNTQTL